MPESAPKVGDRVVYSNPQLDDEVVETAGTVIGAPCEHRTGQVLVVVDGTDLECWWLAVNCRVIG